MTDDLTHKLEERNEEIARLRRVINDLHDAARAQEDAHAATRAELSRVAKELGEALGDKTQPDPPAQVEAQAPQGQPIAGIHADMRALCQRLRDEHGIFVTRIGVEWYGPRIGRLSVDTQD